jgi:anti-sigma regulatory factor (Ser/Thr protein kinase)
MNEKELVIDAKTDKLPEVLAFIDAGLEANDCGPKAQMQLEISVEELFVNVANYAYPDKDGSVKIAFGFDETSRDATISFADSGIPYNLLEKDDPDVTLSAEKRQIGGLGIFMVKKNVDNISYEYKNNQNIVTIIKKI